MIFPELSRAKGELTLIGGYCSDGRSYFLERQRQWAIAAGYTVISDVEWCLRCGYEIKVDVRRMTLVCDCSSGPLTDENDPEVRLMGRVLRRDEDDQYEQELDLRIEDKERQ